MGRRQTNTVIHSYDEIPAFATEAEEADYWATHELSEQLVATMEPLYEEQCCREQIGPNSDRFN